MNVNSLINSIKLVERKITGLERKKNNIVDDIKKTEEYLKELKSTAVKDVIQTYKRRYPQYCHENTDNPIARNKYDIYGKFIDVIDPSGFHYDKVEFHAVFFGEYYDSLFIKSITYDKKIIDFETAPNSLIEKQFNQDLIYYLTHYELLPLEE